ncbi:MAG TPA: M23 family metallopeptidase [Luteolibacter sp.]|nr:M23 family metallopeptidase [Luteolibacter sp.]
MLRLKLRTRIALTLLLAAGLLAWLMFQPRSVTGKRTSFHAADPALEMPADGVMDHRFDLMGGWTMARIPLALRFDPPMGAMTYNAQPFWSMNEQRGGHHGGDDFNGIGGMDSDLGDPVFAVADGLVLYSGEPSSGWGHTLVIAHRTRDGRILQSMYAHLDRLDVRAGVLVGRGMRIGTVGTANGHYPAHLHFEMRDGDQPDIGSGYLDHKLNRLDPAATLAALRGAAPDDFAPSALELALRESTPSWLDLDIGGADILMRHMKEP